MRLMQFVQLFGLKFMEKLICAHQNSFAVFIARYRPYVCLYVTRVDYTKTVEDRIMKFLPHGSPIPLVSSVNSNWFPLARASKREGLERQAIFKQNASISLKRYEIRTKLLLMTNMKLHMRFRLASRLVTLGDPELLCVRIFGEFREIS